MAGGAGRPPKVLPAAFEEEVQRLTRTLEPIFAAQPQAEEETAKLPAALVGRLLLDASGFLQTALLPGADGRVTQELQAARERLAQAGCTVPGVETSARYDWAHGILQGVLTEPGHYAASTTDRIDRW